MSRDGGKLFWDWFESKVISHITEEHAELKRLREKVNKLGPRYDRLRRFIVKQDDLMYCDACEDVFLIDEDETNTCDCGACYCGTDLSKEDICGGTIGCAHCEEVVVCSGCSQQCEGCDEEVCEKCSTVQCKTLKKIKTCP